MPKVSVIIPVYKVEAYLPACLDSVLAQTFPDWEVICVNDGSPDNCGKILAEYAQKDNRIKVITQENQGLSMARNNGLKQAVGEYILFLDSDDFIHPQLLEICYTLAEKEKADMVSFSFQHFSNENEINVLPYDLDKVDRYITNMPLFNQKKRCKWKVSVNTWSKLYRKSLIKDIQFIPGITFEDYPHTYAVLAKYPHSVLLELPLYFYRINPTSISNIQISAKNIRDYSYGLQEVIKTYENKPLTERNFVCSQLIPNILKQQFNKIQKTSKENQAELINEFSDELNKINQKGFLKIWGHKISRYLKYKKIMRNNIVSEKINIAFCINDKYSDNVGVVITSILENHKNDFFKFYIFSSDFSQKSYQKLNKLHKRYSNFEIKIINVDASLFKNLRSTIEYISIETYYRYIIPDLLLEEDKILYLDADLIVNKDIKSFYITNLNDNYLAGVHDLWIESIDYAKELNLSQYINTGVLLMNLKQMRKDCLSQKLIETTHLLQDKIKYADQDIINIVCSGKIIQVNSIYNYALHNIKKEKSKRKKAAIIHYTGSQKPWGNKKVRMSSVWKKYNKIWEKGKICY